MYAEDVPLEKYVERLNTVHSEELNPVDYPACEIRLDEWNAPDTSYRLRVTPVDLEDGSWVADLGPAFKDPDKLRAFMRGLELGGDGTIRRKVQ